MFLFDTANWKFELQFRGIVMLRDLRSILSFVMQVSQTMSVLYCNEWKCHLRLLQESNFLSKLNFLLYYFWCAIAPSLHICMEFEFWFFDLL